MVRISKHLEAGRWRIRANGKPTAFSIIRGQAPRYGMPQTYDLEQDDVDGHPQYLCYFKSVSQAVALIAELANLGEAKP
jgi:hypothetical protein